MDQRPNVVPPVPPEGSEPPKKAGDINLDAILLPKKEARAPGTATRANAGVLLEQEQSATLANQPSSAPPLPPIKKPEPNPETSSVQPLQTYKGDIESLIQDKNVSVVNIAAAEAARRAQSEPAAEQELTDVKDYSLLKKAVMVFGGVVLLVGALGTVYLAYNKWIATVPIQESAPAPFIPVDETTLVVLLEDTSLSRAAFMGALDGARESNDLPLGLIGRLYPAQNLGTEEATRYELLPLEKFLTLLAPSMPPELVRTLEPTYLLGIHTFDGTQAFLILRADTFERGYAGMLAWERGMRNDLLPLFNRSPRPRIPEEGVATSSVGSVPQLLQTGFVDKIIENRDARAILNTSGDLLLLWTFIDRNLLVVTTNEFTLREIISRLGQTPVTKAQ